MKTFGEHELKTQFIHVGDKKIHILENPDGTFFYRRDDVKILIAGRGRVKVLPTPAEGYGVRFLMIRLSTKVAVPPRESAIGYLSAPVDVGVWSGEAEIDRFTVGREKYALYGDATQGVIARYHVSEFFGEEPDSIGVLKLLIRNPTGEWKLVERIVVPIKNSTMFYSPEKAYYPLVILTTKEPYEVNNTGNPPEGMLQRTHEAEPIPNFRMRWWP